MKKLAAAAAALGALAASFVVAAGPASSADAGPVAYTIIQGEGGCDLATLDLTTGDLVDLPAPTSSTACVADLAVSQEGSVWGVRDSAPLELESFTPAAVAESQIQVVMFAADGTASASNVFLDDATEGARLAEGGIAVGAAGIYIQAYLGGGNTGCAEGAPVVCLLTYDPETGLATAIGGSGLTETALYLLTDCTSGQYTIVSDEGGPRLASSNRTTGAVTPAAYTVDSIAGFDCATGTGTLYAIAGGTEPEIIAPLAVTEATFGTIDPTTGAYTEIAAVSDQDASIELLAVVPASAPVTPTTPPPPAAAEAAAVTPAFTG